MSSFFILSEENILIFAIKHYTNPLCLDSKEFHNDFKRIKYIKRLFQRYHTTEELKERLILNHIIEFYNMFTITAATRILFYKIDEKYWPILKTFLLYLNYMPDVLHNIRDEPIHSKDIEVDLNVAKVLKEL